MPQASFATRADQIVGAMRKKYRTQEEVLKALGLIAHEEASEDKPAAAPRAAGMTRLVGLLAAKLKPEDWADVQEHIARLAGSAPDAEDDEDELTSPIDREMRQGATDEPPPFSGRPRTGGAMDSAAVRRFEEQYPGASNTRRDPRPQAAPPRSGKAPSAAAAASFAAMYPGADTIKVA